MPPRRLQPMRGRCRSVIDLVVDWFPTLPEGAGGEGGAGAFVAAPTHGRAAVKGSSRCPRLRRPLHRLPVRTAPARAAERTLRASRASPPPGALLLSRDLVLDTILGFVAAVWLRRCLRWWKAARGSPAMLARRWCTRARFAVHAVAPARGGEARSSRPRLRSRRLAGPLHETTDAPRCAGPCSS